MAIPLIAAAATALRGLAGSELMSGVLGDLSLTGEAMGNITGMNLLGDVAGKVKSTFIPSPIAGQPTLPGNGILEDADDEPITNMPADPRTGKTGATGRPGIPGADGGIGSRGQPGTRGTTGAAGRQGIPGVPGSAATAAQLATPEGLGLASMRPGQPVPDPQSELELKHLIAGQELHAAKRQFGKGSPEHQAAVERVVELTNQVTMLQELRGQQAAMQVQLRKIRDLESKGGKDDPVRQQLTQQLVEVADKIHILEAAGPTAPAPPKLPDMDESERAKLKDAWQAFTQAGGGPDQTPDKESRKMWSQMTGGRWYYPPDFEAKPASAAGAVGQTGDSPRPAASAAGGGGRSRRPPVHGPEIFAPTPAPKGSDGIRGLAGGVAKGVAAGMGLRVLGMVVGGGVGLAGGVIKALIPKMPRIGTKDQDTDTAIQTTKFAGLMALAGGGPASPAGAMGGAFLLNAALISVARSLGQFGDSVLETRRNLADYNGTIAMAFANVDFQKLNLDVRRAGDTRGSTAELARAVMDFREAIYPIELLGMRVLNLAATLTAKVGAVLAALAQVHPTFQLLKMIGEKIEQNTRKKDMEGTLPISRVLHEMARGDFAGPNQPLPPLR